MTLRDLVPSFSRKKVPVRYEYSPLRLFDDNFDRMFNNFFSGFGMEPFISSYSSFSPSVKLRDNEKEIKVRAELPGLDEKDIDVSLANDTLTISGEKKEEHESMGKEYCMKERSYGSFKRSIPLNHEIDTKKVDAHFKKGVLTITLPKTARDMERHKKIHVKVE